MPLDGRYGNAELCRDLGMRQPFELGQQKSLLGRRRKTVEAAVDLDQCLEHHQSDFGGRSRRLGQMGQRFKICLFDRTPSHLVDQQVACNRRQVGARFGDAPDICLLYTSDAADE